MGILRGIYGIVFAFILWGLPGRFNHDLVSKLIGVARALF